MSFEEAGPSKINPRFPSHKSYNFCDSVSRVLLALPPVVKRQHNPGKYTHLHQLLFDTKSEYTFPTRRRRKSAKKNRYSLTEMPVTAENDTASSFAHWYNWSPWDPKNASDWFWKLMNIWCVSSKKQMEQGKRQEDRSDWHTKWNFVLFKKQN